MQIDTKIPVAVLGATGAVGQRFVQLLAQHPWFKISALAASERSAGRHYRDVCRWVIPGDPPPDIGEMLLQPLETNLPAQLVFSALPSDIARDVEPRFAKAGYAVCSNASAYRYADDVPLIIPELNAEHVSLIDQQRTARGWPGLIVTSPNCTTTGIAMALKPLHMAFGVRKLFVTTMQAISGAGHPGVSSLDILDNIIPFIPGEEEKIESEIRRLLGHIENAQRVEAQISASAHANRVPVIDGHTACLSVGFDSPPSVEDALSALRSYRRPEIVAQLPSAPAHPILVREEPNRPQPRRDRDAQGGMAVSVGRVRPCPILDLRMVSVVHNTLRGAASGAILNAELLVAAQYITAERQPLCLR